MNQNAPTFVTMLKLAAAFALVGASLYVVYTISDIVFMFVAAFIFAIALDGPLDRLVARGVPRPLAAISMYVSFFVLVIFAMALILPTLAQESRNLALRLPSYIDNLSQGSGLTVSYTEAQAPALVNYVRTFSDALLSGSQTVIGTISKISGGFITFFVIFFVALFLNIEREGVQRLITLFVPLQHRTYASDLLRRIQSRVGYWLWAKVLSSIFVAAVVFVGLLIIGIDYALTFAVLTFFLNFIPFAGQVAATILPAAIGFFISPVHGVAVILLFALANNIEGFVFMPLIMKRSIQMNPALLIFAVLVGGKLIGVLGIIISIPVAAIVTLLYDEYRGGWKGTVEAIEPEPLHDNS